MGKNKTCKRTREFLHIFDELGLAAIENVTGTLHKKNVKIYIELDEHLSEMQRLVRRLKV